MDRYDEIMERMKRIGCTTEEQVILQLDRELERSRDRIKQEMEYSARLKDEIFTIKKTTQELREAHCEVLERYECLKDECEELTRLNAKYAEKQLQIRPVDPEFPELVPVKESETTSILITSQRKIRDIEVYFQED